MILLFTGTNRIAWYWFYNNWDKASVESNATGSALVYFINQPHKRFDNEHDMDIYANALNDAEVMPDGFSGSIKHSEPYKKHPDWDKRITKQTDKEKFDELVRTNVIPVPDGTKHNR